MRWIKVVTLAAALGALWWAGRPDDGDMSLYPASAPFPGA